jgi:protein TonB
LEAVPKFKGDLKKYLKDSLHYPEREKEAGITGTVYLSFIVKEDGTLDSIKLFKGVPNGPGLDMEAIRLVERMPKWSPAMQNGHPISLKIYHAIDFNLR